MSTISEVAIKAGVAKSTVTKVLKNYPNVSSETRQKVLQAAKELSYVPNIFASQLSSKNNNRVALIINDENKHILSDEVNMHYLRNAFSKSKEMNFNTIVVFISEIKDLSYDELVQYLRSQAINALMVFDLNNSSKVLKDLIEDKQFKVILINDEIINDSTSSITFKHDQNQYDIVRKMINRKEERLLYLYDEDSEVTDLKLKGLYKAQSEIGFELKAIKVNELVLDTKKTIEELANWSTCIACGDEVLVMLVIKSLKEMNIFRPVCGYGQTKLTDCFNEGITSVKLNYQALIDEAFNELDRLIKEGSGKLVMIEA